MHLALTLLLFQTAPDLQSSTPEALRRFFESRSAIQTALIESSHEEWHDGKRQFYYESTRVAGPDVSWCDRGDERGIVSFDETGKEAENGRAPYFGLRKGGLVWEHVEGASRASTTPQRTRGLAPDPRTFGVMYGFSYRSLEDTFWRDPVNLPSARKYSESREGDLWVVTAHTDVGTVKWWIDPDKGWQAARIALFDNQGLLAEARVALAKWGDEWFPKTVQYFVRGYLDAKEPQITINISNAVFNSPDLPQRFSPEDIGIVAGVTVVMERNEAWREVGYGVYDGKGGIKRQRTPTGAPVAADANARAENGKPDPRTDLSGSLNPEESRWQAQSRAAIESLWQRFTRLFIQKYQLKDDQQQNAWNICKECEKQAESYVSGHQSSFERIEARLVTLRNVPAVSEPANAIDGPSRLRAQAEGELELLMRPINKIFQDQLVPRLNKLPTRAQRVAADGVPTSQPPK